MRGPKPKALEVREREGNPGKRPLPGHPVLVGDRLEGEHEIPEMPEHLKVLDVLDENDESVAEPLWRGLCILLADARVLSAGDLLQLGVIVESELVARRSLDELQSGGIVIEGSRGSVRNPALTAWRDARALQLRVCEQYGLTPSARARLGLAGLKGRALERELGAGLPENPVKRDDDEEGTDADDGGVHP